LNFDVATVNKIIDIVKTKVTLSSYPEVGVIKNIAVALTDINQKFPGLGEQIQGLQNGMNFYGLKLWDIPTFDVGKIASDPGTYLPILALALIATVITFFSSKLSIASMNKRNNLNNNSSAANNAKKKANNKSTQPDQMAMTNNMMLWLGPVMTLFISFQVPAGVTLYWAVGYIIMIIQQLYINKKFYSIKEDKKANG
jgi:YidC/Oxa1 family membrane protein insertase